MSIFTDLPTGGDADLGAALKSIDETTTAFVRKTEKLRETVSEKETQVRAARQRDIERAGLVSTENDQRTVDKDRRYTELQFIERGIAADISEYRRALSASSQDERDAMLRSLDEKLARLDAFADTYPNATAWLARSGRGSTEHANLVATLAGAGKAELLNIAREAVLTGNRVLASAVVIAVERMPRHARPFPAIDLATKIVGDEHKALTKNITDARDRVLAAVALNKLFERGGESPASKIERGIRARQAAGRQATA